MKPSKLILLTILTIFITIDLSASRTKKNLLPKQEEEIVSLLKEKISILDKLIIEAKIYKNETDPLIEKDFYNLPSGFVSKYSRSQSSIATATDTSSLVKKKKKKTGYLNVSSNKIGGSSPYLSNSTRKVFGIDNLYIAGSSVFATTGHVNPTFPIIQMTLRLANHINRKFVKV